jgi:hypothetical protein
LPITVQNRLDETPSLEPGDRPEQCAGADLAVEPANLVEHPGGAQWA